MKKIFVSALVLVAATAGMAMAVSYPTTVEKDLGFISVNASSTQEVAPNQAEITVAIETSDVSMQKATSENKILADKVYAGLKGIINTTKGDYIKTGTYTANPVYTYTKDNKRVFDKYVVTNSVVVRTKNTELVPKIVDASISLGATKISGLQFSVTNYGDSCNSALADLTKQAYSQANAVASSIGQKIVGVKSINATCNPESAPRPYYEMMAKAPMVGSSANTPIESGKVKIYANVDASFYVK